MFREIRTSEYISDKVEEKPCFKIKPTSKMTDDECDAFWFNEFNELKKEVEG